MEFGEKVNNKCREEQDFYEEKAVRNKVHFPNGEDYH